MGSKNLFCNGFPFDADAADGGEHALKNHYSRTMVLNTGHAWESFLKIHCLSATSTNSIKTSVAKARCWHFFKRPPVKSNVKIELRTTIPELSKALTRVRFNTCYFKK